MGITPEQIEQWTLEKDVLVARSLYAKRIQFLESNPVLGREPYCSDPTKPYFLKPSNCHGTTFFIHGFKDPHYPGPVFVPHRDMEKFLDRNCVEGKEENGIVVFNQFGNLAHTAIFLGTPAGIETIVHQENVGRDFSIESIEGYESRFSLVEGPYFFKVDKKLKRIWIPWYLT